MSRRVLIIQGHPDPAGGHLAQALAESYAQGASEAGHEVRTTQVAHLDFPLLRSQAEWEKGGLPAALHQAQQDIGWAEHIVIFFPLWLGGMPALRAHSVKSLERNILGFVGIAPVHETLVGLVGNLKPEDAGRWMRKTGALGARAV